MHFGTPLLQLARSTAAGNAGNTIAANALTIWLRIRTRFIRDYSAPPRVLRDEQHELCRQGMLAHLRELVGKVDSKIRVRETDDVSAENVAPRDVVIYFVANFKYGIIRRHLDGVIDDEDASDLHREECELARKAYWKVSKHETVCGLTHTDLQLNRTISEVWADRTIDACPIYNNAGNFRELLGSMAGRALANVAFHEAMHNQIDAHKGHNFDLHGGDGLAKIPITYRSKISTRNISDMRTNITKAVPQFQYSE